jgi:hypothetical protein
MPPVAACNCWRMNRDLCLTVGGGTPGSGGRPGRKLKPKVTS